MTGIIQVDVVGLSEVTRLLADIKSGAPRAITRTLNRTSDKAKVEGIKEIRQDVRLTATYLRKQLRSAKDTPANKATFTRQTSKVNAYKRGIQLGRYVSNVGTVGFGTPDRSPRTKVKPSGGSTAWAGGFLLPIGGGSAVGLFTREGGKLKSRYGPSPSQIWQSEKDTVAPAMRGFMAEELRKETLSILRRYG